MKKGAWQFHRWIGVSLGLYVSLVCLTGSVLTYKDALERMTGRGYLSAPVASTQRHSWQAMYEMVRRAYPDASFTYLSLPAHDRDAPYFRIANQSGRVYVFVNPYTNEILGHDDADNGVTAFVYELHASLLGGGRGRTLNGVGAIGVLVIAATGLVVWWPGQARLWNGFRFDAGARWKRQTRDLHRLTGILTALPLMLIMFTGVYLVFPAPFRSLAAAVSPPGGWFDTPQVVEVKGQTLSLDELIARAHAAMPNGVPRVFRFAPNPKTAWHLRLELPGDWSQSGNNFVHIDQYSGRILTREVHRELPLAIRLLRDNSPIHFGTFGNHWSKALWMCVGVAGAALSMSGAVMFVIRVRRRTTGA